MVVAEKPLRVGNNTKNMKKTIGKLSLKDENVLNTDELKTTLAGSGSVWSVLGMAHPACYGTSEICFSSESDYGSAIEFLNHLNSLPQINGSIYSGPNCGLSYSHSETRPFFYLPGSEAFW